MTIDEPSVAPPTAPPTVPNGSTPKRSTSERGTDLLGMIRKGDLLQGSLWLVISVVLNGAGGFIFWWVAAATLDRSVVGSAQRLFTGVMVVTYLTSVGLPIAVARYSRDESRSSQVLFWWALVLTTVSSVIGTIGFLLLAPASMTDPLADLGTVGEPLTFLAMVTGMSFAILVEVRLMALRQWNWVVGRVFLVVALRFPLLFVHPFDNEALWLFLLIAGAPALSGFVGALALRRHGHRGTRLHPLPIEARPALRYAGVNYLGLLAAQGPNFLLPLIVALNVDDDTYAPFYIAWGVTTVVFLIPHMLGQTLLVEAGKDGANFGHQFRTALGLSVGLMVMITVAVYVMAPLVTRILGDDYVEAQDLMPLMVASAIPWAVTSICLARARALEHTGSIVFITTTFFVSTLGLALVLTPDQGAGGAAIAWALGNTLAALAALSTLVWRRGRNGSTRYGFASPTSSPPPEDEQHAREPRGAVSRTRVRSADDPAHPDRDEVPTRLD